MLIKQNILSTSLPDSFPLHNSLPLSFNPTNPQPAFSLSASGLPFTLVKLEHVHNILEPTTERGGLYLGDIISTKKVDLLLQHRISAVLSCGVEAGTLLLLIQPQPFLYMYTVFVHPPDNRVRIGLTKMIAARDNPSYDISQHFQEGFDFIENCLASRKNVLVHCHAGVSRSAAIVVAYLMKKNRWTLQQGLAYVRQRRNRAKPNEGFLNQLLAYQKIIFSQRPIQSPVKQIIQSPQKPQGSSQPALDKIYPSPTKDAKTEVKEAPKQFQIGQILTSAMDSLGKSFTNIGKSIQNLYDSFVNSEKKKGERRKIFETPRKNQTTRESLKTEPVRTPLGKKDQYLFTKSERVSSSNPQASPLHPYSASTNHWENSPVVGAFYEGQPRREPFVPSYGARMRGSQQEWKTSKQNWAQQPQRLSQISRVQASQTNSAIIENRTTFF